MPRLLGRRRKGAGCGHHGWSCRLGGGSDYVSPYCCPVPLGVSLDHPATDPTGDDAALSDLLLQSRSRMRGITLDEARAEQVREQVEAQAHARRRARMTPAQLCADDDLTDERGAAAIAAERDRKRAERAEIAAEAVPAVPEPTTPGKHRAARSGRLSARPLRVVGGVYDDDDPDPRVIMYAR